MTARRGAGRIVGAVALLVLAVAVTVVLRGRGEPPARAPSGGSPDTPTAAEPPGASPTPAPSPTIGPDAALQLLGSVEAAAVATADDLLRAGLVAGQGPWRGLASPDWPMRRERPVYVGRANVDSDGAVEADVVVALRVPDPTDELVLRLLPAAVGENGLEVTASVDGAPASTEIDAAGLLRIDLDRGYPAEAPVAVRVQLSYELLPTGAGPDGSGPAAYGLLARSPGIHTLGHWLPLLTFEPEPLVPWGDVGSFPPAVWSLQVEHSGTLVTGGSDGECPAAVEFSCTWSRGLALRDVSAVLLEDATVVTSVAAGLTVRTVAARTIGEPALETALAEAVASAESFTRRFGPVAWREFDVVAVPLGEGAAGMEFPGLVLIDDELHDRLSGGFGTYVLVHEVAHQWFHALVGNGSFADPVVDEPLAQYLSVLAYRDLFGPAAAQALVDDTMVARYRRFQGSGLAEEPPAQPSADFAGPGTYGPLIYARAPLAWLAAEDALGVDAVAAFVAALVDRYGLATLSADQLLDDAAATSAELAAILERYWYDAAAVPIP